MVQVKDTINEKSMSTENLLKILNEVNITHTRVSEILLAKILSAVRRHVNMEDMNSVTIEEKFALIMVKLER